MVWLDFGWSPGIFNAVLAVVLLPGVLLVVSRIRPLRGRTAYQFLIGLALTLALWIVLVVRAGGWQAPPMTDVVTGLMVMAAGSMLVLEAWGLLSRGYTLSLLVTLYRAGRPLDEDELARRYRGGEGLEWVMKHRVAGLIGAGLVHEENGRVTLSPVKGVCVARLYRVALTVLGLRIYP